MDSRNKRQTVFQQDSAYGWIIVFSAFSVGVITDGLVFSFGILLVDLLNVFNQGRATTAVIGAILNGVMHLVGPLAGMMLEKFSCRIAVITGALLSFVGLVTSAFVPSLPYLYVTYGFLGGAGFGLMYLPANVSVIQHFNKRRTLATGIAVCGSGVGTFVFNQLTSFLLDQYGWRGTVLIHAGIALQGIILGLLLFPPRKLEFDTNASKENLKETDMTLLNEKSVYDTNGDVDKSLDTDEMLIEKINTDSNKTRDVRNEVRACFNKENLSAHISDEVNKDEDVTENINAENYIKYDTNTDEKDPCLLRQQSKGIIDIEIMNYDEKRNKPKSFCGGMVDLELLHNFKFMSFVLSTFLVNLAFTIPFSLLPDQVMIEDGMSKYQASWLVSSIGITNIVSRIALGWLGDKAFVNRMVMLEAMLFFSGIFTALSPLFVTFEAKLVYTMLYGVFMGGYVTLCPVVLADMVGAENMAKSFGIVLFSVGLSGAISTPISGWIFDMTGSYTNSFILAGIQFHMSGVAILIPKMFYKCKPRQNKRK